MNFEQLQKANSFISTTDIKGKDYAEVSQRIKAFRFLFPKGRIETQMISCENGIVNFKATVKDENGNILGEGHAQEKENSSFINKTSYIENCETSAVGRALAMCGIGIDTSIASYEETANAISNQNKILDATNEQQPLQAPQTEVTCPKCGKVITEMTGAKGGKWHPQQILNKYGMCKECYRADLKNDTQDI